MLYQVYKDNRRVGFVHGVSAENAQKDFLKTLGFKVVPFGNDFEEGDREQQEGYQGS